MRLIIPQNDEKIDLSSAIEVAEKELERITEGIPEEELKDLLSDNILKKFLSRSSMNYITPTLMKAYKQCQACAALSSFEERRHSSAAGIGTLFHSIMEEYYKNEKNFFDTIKENEKRLDEIKNQVLSEIHDPEVNQMIDFYVENYKKTKDYIFTDKTTMDPEVIHSRKYYTEYFVKIEEMQVFKYKVPKPTYCLIDRIDFYNDEIYIIDYKCGKVISENMYGIDGYLPQMLFYRWVLHNYMGLDAKNAYIMAPGDSQYHELNGFHSLKTQSMVVDSIDQFIKTSNILQESKSFKETKMPYCYGCSIKDQCQRITGNTNDIVLEIDEERYKV